MARLSGYPGCPLLACFHGKLSTPYNPRVDNPLGYAARPTYHRRRSARAQGGLMLASAALTVTALALLFEFVTGGWDDGGGGWQRWLVYPFLAVLFAVAALVAVTLIARGGCWETRIEGGLLYLTRPGEPTRVVPLDDVTHLVTRDVTRRDGAESETTRSHELRLRGGGGRVPLDPRAVGWLPAFRRALLRENPRIQFARETEDRPGHGNGNGDTQNIRRDDREIPRGD